MNALNSVWDVIWIAFSIFIFIGYLMALFSIITDLFRDHELGGWAKAIWLVFLLFFPIVTALVYLIARGKGMGKRQAAQIEEAQRQTEDYIRSVSGRSPAQEIAHGKELFEGGTITSEEFEALKAKALKG